MPARRETNIEKDLVDELHRITGKHDGHDAPIDLAPQSLEVERIGACSGIMVLEVLEGLIQILLADVRLRMMTIAWGAPLLMMEGLFVRRARRRALDRVGHGLFLHLVLALLTRKQERQPDKEMTLAYLSWIRKTGEEYRGDRFPKRVCFYLQGRDSSKLVLFNRLRLKEIGLPEKIGDWIYTKCGVWKNHNRAATCSFLTDTETQAHRPRHQDMLY